MKAKRLMLIVIAVCVVSLLVSSASALTRKIGHLSKLNMTQEELTRVSSAFIENGKVFVFTLGEKYDAEAVYYDSIIALQMALTAGEIDEIALPEPVAEYVLNVNNNFAISSIVRIVPSSLSMGFRKGDDPALRNRFNEALLSMKADGTLAILRAKYIDEPGLDEPEAVKFEVYDNIDTKIKVAVTGDLPPIDFVAADGKAAGFNTAVLAEIGKRLHVNIELVNIDSGARAASLASGRADVVFWIQSIKGSDEQADVPEGIALSEPYFSWNEDLLLKLAK